MMKRCTVICLLLLAACGAHSRPVTTSEATFLFARPHQLVVELDLAGAFSSQRLLPLDDSVKVTVGGKVATLEKLHEGQRVRISRDAQTREVTAIEGL